VFRSQFVQTHVRVYRTTAGIEVVLSEHPRRAQQRLLGIEGFAVAGRFPSEPDNASQRIRAHASVQRE
jgi:hypothetical protein